MPNIPTYDQPQLGLTPTEVGIQATTQAAYRGRALYDQAAESLSSAGQKIGSGIAAAGDAAVKYVEHREINTGSAHAAQFVLNHNQSWNDFIKGNDIPQDDPNRLDLIAERTNNPHAFQEWSDKQLEPDFQKFREGFATEGGQKWADGFIDRYREHAALKGAADQSTMAGEVAKANTEKTLNLSAQAVFNEPDVFTLRSQIELLDHSIRGNTSSSPMITPDTASRINTEFMEKSKEHLVQTAIQSSILKGGNWRKIANDPDFAQYVKPTENALFERQARSQDKFNDSIDRAVRAQQKQEAVVDLNQKTTEIKFRNMNPDGSFKSPTPQDFQDLKQLTIHPGVGYDPGRLTETYKFLTSAPDANNIQSDPTTYSHLKNGILDGATKEMDLLRAVNSDDPTNKISSKDYTYLHTQLEHKDKDPDMVRIGKDRVDFIKRMEMTVDPAASSDVNGKHSALGELAIYKLQKDLEYQEELLRKKPGGDPSSLYDPSSPNYFGKPGNLQRYVVPLADAQAYQAKTEHGLNLTGPNEKELGRSVIDVPAGMTPAQVVKQFRSGQRIKLPDGRIGTVP